MPNRLSEWDFSKNLSSTERRAPIKLRDNQVSFSNGKVIVESENPGQTFDECLRVQIRHNNNNGVLFTSAEVIYAPEEIKNTLFKNNRWIKNCAPSAPTAVESSPPESKIGQKRPRSPDTASSETEGNGKKRKLNSSASAPPPRRSVNPADVPGNSSTEPQLAPPLPTEKVANP